MRKLIPKEKKKDIQGHTVRNKNNLGKVRPEDCVLKINMIL